MDLWLVIVLIVAVGAIAGVVAFFIVVNHRKKIT